MTNQNPWPSACPACAANLHNPHAGPDEDTYRVLMVSTVEADMCLYWECPDCGHGWPMYTDGPYATSARQAADNHNRNRT